MHKAGKDDQRDDKVARAVAPARCHHRNPVAQAEPKLVAGKPDQRAGLAHATATGLDTSVRKASRAMRAPRTESGSSSCACSPVAIGGRPVAIIFGRPVIRVVTILQSTPLPPRATNSPVSAPPRVIIPIGLVISIVTYVLNQIRFLNSRTKTGQ